MGWPGFTTEPCHGCDHAGDHHQPRCVDIVVRAGNAEYCGCPAYICPVATQPALFAPGRG